MSDDGQTELTAASTCVLVEGVRFEPFADGTAILHALATGQTVSLNPAAALLCACADGEHTLADVANQANSFGASGELDVGAFAAVAHELVRRGFLAVKSP